jgi:hypothetical protein
MLLTCHWGSVYLSLGPYLQSVNVAGSLYAANMSLCLYSLSVLLSLGLYLQSVNVAGSLFAVCITVAVSLFAVCITVAVSRFAVCITVAVSLFAVCIAFAGSLFAVLLSVCLYLLSYCQCVSICCLQKFHFFAIPDRCRLGGVKCVR